MAKLPGFNAFQRELVNRDIPDNQKYLFTMQYEHILQISKDLDTMSEIVLQMANTMQGLQALSEDTQKKLVKHQRGQNLGIDVMSVRNEPEN